MASAVAGMIDKHSDTWREVAAWARLDLTNARERLETIRVDPVETENLRGRIASLKDLVALAEDPEQRVVEAVDDYGFQGPGDAT